jgi:hypothetical protein
MTKLTVTFRNFANAHRNPSTLGSSRNLNPRLAEGVKITKYCDSNKLAAYLKNAFHPVAQHFVSADGPSGNQAYCMFYRVS